MQVTALLQISSEPLGTRVGSQFFVVLAGVPDSLNHTTGRAKSLVIFPDISVEKLENMIESKQKRKHSIPVHDIPLMIE